MTVVTTAEINVTANTAAFDHKLRADVGSAIKRAEATAKIAVTLGADPSGLKAEVSRAAKAAEVGNDVELDVEADSTGLRGEVGRAARVAEAGSSIKLKVEVDQSFLGFLGGSLPGVVALGVAFESLKLPLQVAQIGLAVQGLAALAGAAVAVAGAIAPLASALPALGVAASSLGQAGLTASFALRGVGTALKELAKEAALEDDLAETFARLSSEAGQFARFLFSLRPALESLQAAAGKELFPGLTAGIKASLGLLPLLREQLQATGGAIGDVVRRGGELAVSGPFALNLQTVLSGNVGIIRSLGDALLFTASTLSVLFAAGAPLAQELATLVANTAQFKNEAILADAAGGALGARLEKAKAVAQTLGGILSDLGTTLGNVFRASAPLGESLLVTLEGLAENAAKVTSSVAGTAALTELFQGIRPVLTEVGGLFGDVAKAIAGLATDGNLAGVIKAVRAELLPAVLHLVEAVGTSFAGDFVHTLALVVDSLAELNTSFAFLFPVIDAALVGFAPLVPVLGRVASVVSADLVKAIEILAPALVSVLTALEPILPALVEAKVVFGILSPVITSGSEVFKLLGSVINKAVIPAVLSLSATLGIGVLPLIAIGAAVAVLGVVVVKNFDTIKAVVLGAVRVVGDALGSAGDFIGDLVGRVVDFVAEWGLLFLGPVGIIIKFRDEIGDALAAVGRFIGDLVGRVVDFVQEWGVLFLGPVGVAFKFRDKIGDAVGAVVGFVAGLPGRVVGALGELVGLVAGTVADVAGAVASLPGRVGDVVGDLFAAAARVGSSILKGIASGIGAVGDFVGDFAAGVGNAIIDFINANIVDRINDAIPNSIDLPGPLGSINLPDNPVPRIPRFRRGGTALGLALVGEEGPELVRFGRPAQVSSASETARLLGATIDYDRLARVLAEAMGSAPPSQYGPFQFFGVAPGQLPQLLGAELRRATFLSGR